MSERELPGSLKRELDEQPLRLVAEYLCARLGQDRGERELRITFRDGRYDRGSGGAAHQPFAKLQN